MKSNWVRINLGVQLSKTSSRDELLSIELSYMMHVFLTYLWDILLLYVLYLFLRHAIWCLYSFTLLIDTWRNLQQCLTIEVENKPYYNIFDMIDTNMLSSKHIKQDSNSLYYLNYFWSRYSPYWFLFIFLWDAAILKNWKIVG